MNKHIQSLDGLRAVAVISVMSFPCGLIESGWMGVQAFFVLSGYLITRILLAEKNESLAFYMKRFYWRWSLRIFPVYYAYLLLFLLRYIFTYANDDFRKSFPTY
jgi:peptidoglycan/LPS O-acetylase OafA/YrhL